MTMHAITVIAEELSPAHLLAAIKHWVAKFEQEIANMDDGRSARGHYAFDHDGKATEVHWNAVNTVNHMQPGEWVEVEGGSESSGVSLGLHITPPSAYVPGAPLTGAALARDQLLGQMLGNEESLVIGQKAPAPAPVDEPGPIDSEVSEAAADPATVGFPENTVFRDLVDKASPTPAELTEAAEHAAAQPDSSAADVAVAVALDLA